MVISHNLLDIPNNSDTPFLVLTTERDSVKAVGSANHVVDRNQKRSSAEINLFLNDPNQRTTAISAWSWDGQQLRIRTSETGLIPIYYAESKGLLAISTSLRFLVQHVIDAKIDWGSVLICLALGTYIEDLTAFAEIKIVPLHSTFSWSRIQGIRLERNSRTYGMPAKSFDRAILTYNDLFRDAINQSLPAGQWALGLSGGRDSRKILLTLMEAGTRPHRLVTSGHYLSFSESDTSIAKILARRTKNKITEIKPLPDRWRSEIEKNIQTEFQTLSHSWLLPMSRNLEGITRFYDGLNAGGLFQMKNLAAKLRSTYGDKLPPWETIKDFALEHIFDRKIDKFRSIFPSTKMTKGMIEDARIRLASCLENYQYFPSPLQAFHYFNITMRSVALQPYSLMKNSEVECSFDKPEMVSWALGQDFHISSDYTFRNEALRRAFPEYTDIPFNEDYSPKNKSSIIDRDQENHSIAEILSFMMKSELEMGNDKFITGLTTESLILRDIVTFIHLAQLQSLEKRLDINLGVND